MSNTARNVLACSTEGCRNRAARGDRCWACLKREARESEVSGPPRPYGQSIKRLLTEAALAYADCESEAPGDKALRAAWHRLRMAARRYVQAEKPTDPRGRVKIVHTSVDSAQRGADS